VSEPLFELHTLSWPNADARLETAQDAVFAHFDLPLRRHKRHMRHGVWMDEVMRTAQAPVVGFFDNDCIPLRASAVAEAVAYAATHRTFCGIAQASNHIGTRAHIFAAPAFYVIWRQAWFDLGQPTFAETKRSDVAEEVSYVAEEKGLRYRALYPTAFEAEPTEGVWRLSNYGFFGIGTVFSDAAYHLYQGRKQRNVDLFVRRCRDVIEGTFTTAGMHDALTYYPGRVVP
jgi:hypothetical protein